MRVIEVFAELCCPFTHVGLRRLVAEREARGRDDVVLHVRAWPLELVNGEPLDPQHVAREIAAIRRGVAPDLFAGFRADHFPATSLPALVLANRAYAGGDLRRGEAVSLDLRWRLFEQGEDLADPAVLAAVAATHGLDGLGAAPRDDPVAGDYAEGQLRGVTGSPHFFLGGEGFFCPVLTIRQVDGEFDVQVDEPTLARFLDLVFA